MKVCKKEIFIYLSCLFVSFVVLMLFSHNSFLYPMNTWYDVNCFFTLGRSILHGKVLYRDLFEQKGPVLFVYYFIASLLSERTFHGIFVIEVISYSVLIFYFYKLIKLFVGRDVFSLISSLYLGISIPQSVAYNYGGSLESFALPMMVIAMYLFSKDVLDKNPISKKSCLIIGIFAALTFWMKYTLSGYFFGMIIFVIYYYIKEKYVTKHLTSSVVYFLIGFFIVTAIVILYFAMNNALIDLFEQYFYNNIFVYADFENSSYINVVFGPAHSILDNYLYGILIVIGGLHYLFTITKDLNKFLMIFLPAFFLCVSTYGGGVYWEYYGLPISIFSFIGFIPLYQIYKLIEKKLINVRFINILLTVIVFMVTVIITSLNFMNIDKIEKKDLFQYYFAEIILKEDNPTILNYGCLDLGVYFTTNITPNCKYYYKGNHLPFVKEEQAKFIENNEVMFIVTDRHYDFPDYSLIFDMDGCYLYKLNNDF